MLKQKGPVLAPFLFRCMFGFGFRLPRDGRVKEQFLSAAPWAGFASLVLGVIPFMFMVAGYLLEGQQVAPDLLQLSCHAIETELQKFKSDYGVSLHPNFMQSYDPEKCRIAGGGTATIWFRPGDPSSHGFIYANLSDAQIFEQVGYRTFFHDLSEERWLYTLLLALPWLPLVWLQYSVTSSIRLLPWKRVG